MKIFNTIKFLLLGVYKYRLNLIATLKINFKFLSFKEAIIFPICIYGKCKFYDLTGKIFINYPLKFGLIRIGQEVSRINGYKQWTCITIKGTIIFNGPAYITHNSNIEIKKMGTLTLGINVFFNARARIVCENNIFIGDYTRLSWDVQIFDTNFHYFINQGKINKKHSSIFIGKACWIGNRVTIAKGSYICNNTIVGSNSLINKNYREYEHSVILAGIPAKFIAKGVKQISNISIELKLDEYFYKHEINEVNISSMEILKIISMGKIYSNDGI